MPHDTVALIVIAGAMVVDALVAVATFVLHVWERDHRVPRGAHGRVH